MSLFDFGVKMFHEGMGKGVNYIVMDENYIFGDEHTEVFTKVKIYCIYETYIVL